MSARRQWRLEASDGQILDSWYEATEAMVHDPALTFEEVWMFAGEEQVEDATSQVRKMCGMEDLRIFPHTVI